MNKLTDKETIKLKDFALVMALALTIFGGIAFYKSNPIAALLFLTALLFLSLGIFAPKALVPLEKYWMIFAEKISIVSTFILVLISFFFVLTPIAFLLKILGKDPIEKGPDKDRKTYWEDAKDEKRYFLPY